MFKLPFRYPTCFACRAFEHSSIRASVRQEQTPTLENLRCTISCTAYRVWGPIKSSFGPTIRLQRKMGFSRSSVSVGLNFTFDPTHTNRETGVAVSLSANQGQYEMGVESNLSENGPEYAFTGQLHGFGNLRAGIEVWNHSFKELLHPLTAVDNSRVFFGCRVNRSVVKTDTRFCLLPFESMKNSVSSNLDEAQSDSNSLPSKDKQIELVFRQKNSKTN